MRARQKRQKLRCKPRVFFFWSAAQFQATRRRPLFGEAESKGQGLLEPPSYNSSQYCTGRKTSRRSKAPKLQRPSSRYAAAIEPAAKARSATGIRDQSPTAEWPA